MCYYVFGFRFASVALVELAIFIGLYDSTLKDIKNAWLHRSMLYIMISFEVFVIILVKCIYVILKKPRKSFLWFQFG